MREAKGIRTSGTSGQVWMELDEHLAPRDGSFEPEVVPEDFGILSPQPSRRSFLKTLGVGAAAALAACQRRPVENAIPFLLAPEEITPGLAAHYASTCTACPAACGLLVTVRDGRPVKLEGNPAHPLSGGGLCAVGQADIRGLYDPGRLQGPTVAGKPVSWSELDGHVRARLEEVRMSGRPVHVLATSISSPTARRAIEEFLAPYGGRLVEHDAWSGSPSALAEAYEVLTGRALVPSFDFAPVDLWVSFASDLLGTGPEPVAHTRSWAARRRASADHAPARLVQIEGNLSLTGAAADQRIPATTGERRHLALSLLAAVARRRDRADLVPRLASDAAPEMESIADALVAATGRSLVTAGDNDLAVQLSVALINRVLSNEGQSVDITRPSLVARGVDRELAHLVEDIRASQVGGLIMLSVDPVGTLPDGEDLAAAIAGLKLTVAISDRPTASARAAQVVAAAHHGLESWGDFEPRPGLVSLAQPAIRPLFDTRHAYASFLHWSGAPVTDWRLHLMAAWGTRFGDQAAGDDWWTRQVASGGLLAPAPAALAADDGEPVERPAPADVLAAVRDDDVSDEGLELELLAEVGRRDGSRGHIPWLAELPDPLTRCSWSACARVAPATALAQGLRDGDVVTIVTATGSVLLPVRVMPGQHPRVVGVPVGYGLEGGKASENGYRLARRDGASWKTSGIPLSQFAATGTRERLPLIQIHARTEGRPVVHQVSHPGERVPAGHQVAAHGLWPERAATSPHWEMVLNLDACTGCSACVVACQAENNIPVVGPEDMANHRDMHWLRIDRYFVGDADQPDVLFEPMLCAQCGNAPCETVCPVVATVHSVDGLNQQIYNRCVGTRYCANNCPYKVRRFNWFDRQPKDPLERMVLNPDVVVRDRGVMEKCTFCVQRIQARRIDARKAGHPERFEVQTACQQSCPAGAIAFGDATLPAGEVALWKQNPRAFQVLADLGVKPSITYLARVRNRPGAEPHRAAGHGEKA